jgi:hypothetical protein
VEKAANELEKAATSRRLSEEGGSGRLVGVMEREEG